MLVKKPDARIVEVDGILDDVYEPDADIHIEHLGSGSYFIGITRRDGSRLVLSGKKIGLQWTEHA